MKAKYLVPAILFLILSLLVITGNTIFMVQGRWGLWSVNHISAIVFHLVTIIVAIYMFFQALKKDEAES